MRYLIIALFVIASIIIMRKITINITSSMPLGLYIKQSGDIKRGDIVLVCLSEAYKTIGLQRHYVIKGNKCDGMTPLIKKVIAIPGDKVTLTDEYIKVNEQKYFYLTYYYDSKKRALNVYPRGEYNQGYWLIGANDKHSWDSRYFGPVKKWQILFKLNRVI
jgi:conjugative transfer signal peptidase TraF